MTPAAGVASPSVGHRGRGTPASTTLALAWATGMVLPMRQYLDNSSLWKDATPRHKYSTPPSHSEQQVGGGTATRQCYYARTALVWISSFG